jgi:hypothetical protein
MKSDTHIKQFVEDEIRWDPDVDASEIAISADDIEVQSPGIDPRPDPAISANGIRMVVDDGWVAVEATGDEVVLNGWLLERP